MTAKSKRLQLIGLGIMAVGFVFLMVAWRGLNAPVEPIAEAMLSNRTDRTMLYLMLGVVTLVGGTVLSMPGRRKS